MVLGAGSVELYHAGDIASMAAYPGLDSQNQNASSLIAQDIRQSSSVDVESENRIVLHVHTLDAVNSVTYSFDSAAHSLTRFDGQGSSTLLRDVEIFSFSLFQRPCTEAA